MTRGFAVALGIALASCAGEAMPLAERGRVVGKATAIPRVALTPAAVAIAELLDVSRADAPAIVLAEQRHAPAGPMPIRFELEYDPARIEPAHGYAVAVRILEGERLRWVTDTRAPVLTRGAPATFEIVLRQVQ